MSDTIPPMRIFISDGQQRKSLAVVRSLGKRGHFVVVGEDTGAAVSLFSRYCSMRVVYPSARKRPDEFHAFLLGFIEKAQVEVLFPMDDPVCDVVCSHYSEYSARVKLVMPPPEAFVIGRDKFLTSELASRKGIRAPAYALPENPAQALHVARKIGFPCVIKPRRSSGARGLSVVEAENQFLQVYEKVSALYGPPIIQEFIPPGPKYDVCLLYDRNSVPRVSFVQRELRNYPIPHGPSTLQESVFRPDLVEMSVRLLDGTGWRSVVEVEYMIDPRDNRPVLMEVNPRFWASLKCAILSGVQFPELALREAVGEDVPDIHSYRCGVRCRWLLPGDILHFVSNPRRWSLDPPFFCCQRDTWFDIIERDDPGPVLGVALAVIRYLFDREMWRFVVRN